MLIPFDGKPITCKIGGITFSVAAPTDETFLDMQVIDARYGKTSEERRALFEKEPLTGKKWRDECVNRIVVGWSGAQNRDGTEIPFPENGCASLISYITKTRLINFFYNWDELTPEDLKNS
jgi:hypothetical protein